MDIICIENLRDCGTASVIVKNEDDTRGEYLIHGNNFGNARIDVTKGGWKNQTFPTFKELSDLQHALINFDHKKSPLYVGELSIYDALHLNRHAHELAGMVKLFHNYLDNTENAPLPIVVPDRDVVQEVTDKLANQIQESMMDDLFNELAKKYKEGSNDEK